MIDRRLAGWVFCALAGSALGASACGHAHTVDAAGKPSDKTDKASDSDAGSSVDKSEKPAHAAVSRADDATADDGRAAANGDKRRDPAATTAVPVATSPDALLAPGGAAEIRRKLVAAGYLRGDDDPLGSGLRKFQQNHDLPATGMPDHATVAKLGLDPKKIFKHAKSP
jgi:putative peptidoglycan binding protein